MKQRFMPEIRERNGTHFAVIADGKKAFVIHPLGEDAGFYSPSVAMDLATGHAAIANTYGVDTLRHAVSI